MSGDFWGIWNSFQIDDTNIGVRSEAQLTDLRDRAAYLAKKTGQEPVSWYEFKLQQPKQPPSRGVGSTLWGALIGGLLGAMMWPLAVVTIPLGIVLGGLVGNFGTENTRRTAMIKNYGSYLDNFEITARAMQPAVIRNDHAERVRTSQQHIAPTLGA